MAFTQSAVVDDRADDSQRVGACQDSGSALGGMSLFTSASCWR